MTTHYEVLEISTNASDDEIKKAHRKLALKWHPDKNIENKAQATEKFRVIQEAYECLKSPEERRKYDLTLNSRSHRQQPFGFNHSTTNGFQSKNNFNEKNTNPFQSTNHALSTAKCNSGYKMNKN